MYERIPQVIQGMDVLGVATGPGLLAKHVAHAAHKMIATDIIRHDLQHEELLGYHPQKWVSEAENCCGILTGG
ncbi:MAG: hypothetical protein LUE61_10895 [Clostridiales bacterium]|nr:hypothetical protein [Clostridiales bacterium]